MHSWALQYRKDMDITEVSTAKSHKDNKGTGPSAVCGEAERTGTVQLGD